MRSESPSSSTSGSGSGSTRSTRVSAAKMREERREAQVQTAEGGGSGSTRSEYIEREMAWHGWVGAFVLLVNQALLPWQIGPLARWFTPVMWTAYILLADAWVLRRDGPLAAPRSAPGGRVHGDRLDPALAPLRGLQRASPELGVLRGARVRLGRRRRLRLVLRHDLAGDLRDGRAPGGGTPAHPAHAAEARAPVGRAPRRDGRRRRLRHRPARPPGRRAAMDLRLRVARIRAPAGSR